MTSGVTQADWLRAFDGTCPFVVAGPGPAGVTGLIRSLTTGKRLACPITVLPISEPDRNHTSVLARRERMTMLAEVVDVVIGVDTHKHTHTAAVIDAATGASLDEADRRHRP